MTSRRLPTRALASLLIGTCLPGLLAAQSAQRWSVQASAIGVGGGGDAFAGVSTGWGGEAQIRYTPSAFSLGVWIPVLQS